MITIPKLAGRAVAVMGLGRSGLSAARALMASGCTVRAWDDDDDRRREAAAEGMNVAPLADGAWHGGQTLVLSPGIPHTYPKPHPVAARARDAHVEIVGDMELLARTDPAAQIVAITGTNGKSTTTALVGHVLERCGVAVAVGGNLGTPVLDLAPLGADGRYVLELSSYQIDLTTTAFVDIAVLLNLSPDHLDRHGGFAGYKAAKERLFDLGRPGCRTVVGIDDADSRAIWKRLSAAGRAPVPIAAGCPAPGGVYAADGLLIDDLDGKADAVLALADIETLPGIHNAQNAAAAYAVARLSGLAPQETATAMRSYPGLPHRQQLVAVLDGVRYVNDSKATNPDAAVRALACYHAIYWIAGGRAKEGGIDMLTPYLPRVAAAFLIGEAAPAMGEALAGRVPVHQCGTLARAVDAAHRAARAERRPDPVVLLSPACASFDQFTSFEDRGRKFCALVKALPGADRRVFCSPEAV